MSEKKDGGFIPLDTIVIRINGESIISDYIQFSFIDGYLTCITHKRQNENDREYLDETWYEENRNPIYTCETDVGCVSVPPDEQVCEISRVVRCV